MPVNRGLSRAIGSVFIAMAGTIWVSKTPTADTRKATGIARPSSGLPVRGVFGTTSRCSVLPGLRCSRAASCGSIDRLADGLRTEHPALQDLDLVR